MLRPEAAVYQSPAGRPLRLFIFAPPPDAPRTRTAILFFHGGGYRYGSPRQFFPQARYFAGRGVVAFSAAYRLLGRGATTPRDILADGQAALGWVQQQADHFGYDPHRIVLAGGSAGGHLALACALNPWPAGHGPSPQAAAWLLFNPAIDLVEIGTSDLDSAISPAAWLRPGLPPMLILHGTADAVIPFAKVAAFAQQVQAAGGVCNLIPFPDRPHGFFNYAAQGNHPFRETLRLADAFLAAHGLLPAAPFVPPADPWPYRLLFRLRRALRRRFDRRQAPHLELKE